MQEPLEETVAYLGGIALFQDVKDLPGALEAIVQKLRLAKYLPGENILTEGESGSELFILKSGQASVYKSTSDGESYKITVLHSDNHVFFGEGGLLDSDSRSATIQADKECVCLILDQSAIRALSVEQPQWALPILMRISRVVMGRLRKSNNDLVLLYNALVAEIRGQ